MKGVVVEKAQAPWKVVEDLPMPEPSDDQILVKSIYGAVNPVDTYMCMTGLLVVSWPFIPGCDAGGVVVKTGKNAVSPLGKPFKQGDGVCGCTRLGNPGHSTFEEYYLMDAKCTTPIPPNLTLDKACTVGVASYTASLGVFQGLNVPIPDPENPPAPKDDDWALVLGGASSVGKMAINILKIAGFKVIATASQKSFDVLKSAGADDCVDYKQSQDAIIAEIVSKTSGNMTRIFDAVAQHIEFSVPMFKAIEKSPKYFSTTNDWTPLPNSESFESYHTQLGPIGRPDAVQLNKDIESFIPFIYKGLALGKLQPSEYQLIGNGGIEDVIEAWNFQQSGKAGSSKVIVKLADA